ncbi:HTH-type transcriptional regulator CdhR (plasmid) [Pseudosulfitobacter pseudonitzschiae]|uniref:HTH-type transcriptional regulator CdhR n=1 Tax=Pseudosulfitobacter pseudonitzschiae TaxID=1402135 RepID=A0A221K8W4_9RHOB|nr:MULTISPECIES: helix-turn-helix domain-containing protein [Roseobacteraceae]ASM75451.1 HTH-type transcriptional regulator CdhR [Pseudosulfitobacter pseudonitzschiae]
MTIKTAVIGSRIAGTSVLFSILDILASVGRDWEMLHGLPTAEPIFHVTLRTLDGAPYWDINGRKITPDAALAERPVPDFIIVPDLLFDPNTGLPEDFAPVAEWINGAYARGAIVTSVCSGAVLLGAAGLLDGKGATTHWGYADMLGRAFPHVKVCRERILIPAGDGHRVITAGGTSAWADLMLYLIGRFAGADEARRIAKIYLIDPHSDGQLSYASLTAGGQHDDQLVADAQIWAAQNYDTSSPVAAMAARSQLTERGFSRRFKKATGQAPASYVQTLRVEEAKQLLETTAMPIDDIAAEVGYSEPSSFRSAFRKHVGISASAYRKKWRALAPMAS